MARRDTSPEVYQAIKEQKAPLTPLEMAIGRLMIQFGQVLGALQDAPEEEIIRDGTGYLSRIQKEIDLLMPVLMPFDPGTVPFGANADEPEA